MAPPRRNVPSRRQGVSGKRSVPLSANQLGPEKRARIDDSTQNTPGEAGEEHADGEAMDWSGFWGGDFPDDDDDLGEDDLLPR